MLLALALAEPWLRPLPLTPAVIHLGAGLLAGALFGELPPLQPRATVWRVITELAVLVSLFAVGLRLQVPRTWRAWSAALWLAGPGMLAGIVLAWLLAVVVLELPWPAALLLAAILAPTDPVLASEVQIESHEDRDAVRLTLSAEGGLNDGTALPVVMLALGALGLHELGGDGFFDDWWWRDALWPIGGGAVIGALLGAALNRLLLARLAAGDPLLRDELLYMGAVALAYGCALASATSAFVVTFACAVMLLPPRQPGRELVERLHGFGVRSERLVEAVAVMAVGVALVAVAPDWRQWLYALLLVLVVRPLSVLSVIRRGAMTRPQRRLVAWFGIRGIGALFYLAYAIEHGVAGALADEMIATTLMAIALSIVLHGVSATPLMTAYRRRR